MVGVHYGIVRLPWVCLTDWAKRQQRSSRAQTVSPSSSKTVSELLGETVCARALQSGCAQSVRHAHGNRTIPQWTLTINPPTFSEQRRYHPTWNRLRLVYNRKD